MVYSEGVALKNSVRDQTGKFVKLANSLHPKTIGLRLHRGRYEQFLELAEKMESTPAELARKVIEKWMEVENNGS